MFKFVILFLVLSATAFAAEYDINECAGIPKPLDFSIEECPDGDPCTFQIGQTLHYHWTFNLEKPATTLPYSVSIVRPNGQVFFYPLPNPDLCSNTDGGCPLEAGNHVFHGEVVAPDVVPGEELLIAGVARDQDYNTVGCYSHKMKFTAA